MGHNGKQRMARGSKAPLVTRWQIGYERQQGTQYTVSRALYTYVEAMQRVARLKLLGNDAWIAGAVLVRMDGAA